MLLKLNYCRSKQHSAALQVWALSAKRNTHTPSKFISSCTSRAAVGGKIHDRLTRFMPFLHLLCSGRWEYLCCQMKCTVTWQLLLWTKVRWRWEYTTKHWFYLTHYVYFSLDIFNPVVNRNHIWEYYTSPLLETLPYQSPVWKNVIWMPNPNYSGKSSAEKSGESYNDSLHKRVTNQGKD